MKRRSVVAIAWFVWALSMGSLAVPLAYRLAGRHIVGFGDQPGSIAAVVAVMLFIPTFATVGAVLAAKRPGNPIGWLISASGLCYALGVLGILIGTFSSRWSDWLSDWVWGIGIGLPATFVLLLFPTGTLPSRRWRPVAWLGAVALGGTFLGNAFSPGVIQGSHSINPLGIGGPHRVGPEGNAGSVRSGVRGRNRQPRLAGVPVPQGGLRPARTDQVAGLRGRTDPGRRCRWNRPGGRDGHKRAYRQPPDRDHLRVVRLRPSGHRLPPS